MFTCCLFVSFCSPSIQRSFRSLSAIFKFFSQPYNRTSCVVRSTCTRQPLCSSNKATLGWCWLHDISLSKPVEFHFHYKSPWILPTATLLSKLVAAGRNSMLSCCPKSSLFSNATDDGVWPLSLSLQKKTVWICSAKFFPIVLDVLDSRIRSGLRPGNKLKKNFNKTAHCEMIADS